MNGGVLYMCIFLLLVQHVIAVTHLKHGCVFIVVLNLGAVYVVCLWKLCFGEC